MSDRRLGLVLLCCAVLGCASRRLGGPLVQGHEAPTDTAAPTAASSAVDYEAQFVGSYKEGSAEFVERVGRVLARHPTLAAARPGEGEMPLHLELTLTNRTNGLVAALSGLVCGLSFTLLPAYARDDFDLDVELRAGERSLWRRQYHDAVTTFVHVTLVFAERREQPRVVVEDVVDDLVRRALADLDASGALQLAAAGALDPQPTTDSKGAP